MILKLRRRGNVHVKGDRGMGLVLEVEGAGGGGGDWGRLR